MVWSFTNWRRVLSSAKRRVDAPQVAGRELGVAQQRAARQALLEMRPGRLGRVRRVDAHHLVRLGGFTAKSLVFLFLLLRSTSWLAV